ncbi:MAG: DEAD/DEAH box helicase [Bacteroidales bacterium]|nr:DEAD/DEAH box helicase [Bacteroidales bacterium]
MGFFLRSEPVRLCGSIIYNPHRKPDGMSLTDWQKALRRQAAAHEQLVVSPMEDVATGYFKVYNPTKKRTYTVVYRGPESSWNYCSCPDFHTNQLGTCKHIEAVGMAAGGKYARKRYQLPLRSSIYLDYRGKRRVRIRIGDERRDEMLVLAARYFDSDMNLLEGMNDRFEEFLDEARKIDPSLKCSEDALDFIIHARETSRRNRLADEHPEIFDNIINTTLYPYQRQGVEFAFRRGRTVIADEMGLGKTIQAIAVATLLKRHGFVRSAWVVCPASLKYQWKNEIERFSGETADVIEGNVVDRTRQLADENGFFKIISYQSLVNCILFGLKSMPDMIIYDEVQRLKNRDTKMARTMRLLKSDYVVALSGTPLENRITELYSVMQLTDQFVLGPYWKFISDTTDVDNTGRIVGYRNLNNVGKMLMPVMIRRTKREVQLEMPARVDKNLFVTATKEQLAVHDDCKWQIGSLIHRWKKMGFLPEKDRKRIMLLLSMMRMVADSTFIIDQKSRYDTKIDEAMNIIGEIIETGDEKIVIFSQWERMQRLMAAELDKQGINYRFLHGSVPSMKRGKLIEDFIKMPDCRVFLSTDAGSTGLNLQAASIMINLDLPWNPGVLEQRIARVFRLGQTRHVQVINMISVGTIEERILDTIAFKTGMFEGILDGGEDSVVLNNKKFDRIAEIIDSDLDLENAEPSAKPQDEDIQEPTEHESAEAETIPDELKEIEEDVIYDDLEIPEDHPDSDDVEDSAESEDSVAPEDDLADEQDHRPTHSIGDTNIRNGSDDVAGLLSKGISVFGELAETLATPESRKRLVDSIVKEDPETGQTSLSIPVSDKQTVSNIVNLFAGILSALRK